METTYVTRNETASLLGVSPRTVSRYAQNGKLRRYYRVAITEYSDVICTEDKLNGYYGGVISQVPYFLRAEVEKVKSREAREHSPPADVG